MRPPKAPATVAKPNHRANYSRVSEYEIFLQFSTNSKAKLLFGVEERWPKNKVHDDPKLRKEKRGSQK